MKYNNQLLTIPLLCSKSTFIRAEAFDREIKEGMFWGPKKIISNAPYDKIRFSGISVVIIPK